MYVIMLYGALVDEREERFQLFIKADSREEAVEWLKSNGFRAVGGGWRRSKKTEINYGDRHIVVQAIWVEISEVHDQSAVHFSEA